MKNGKNTLHKIFKVTDKTLLILEQAYEQQSKQTLITASGVIFAVSAEILRLIQRKY